MRSVSVVDTKTIWKLDSFLPKTVANVKRKIQVGVGKVIFASFVGIL